jgi:DNA primase
MNVVDEVKDRIDIVEVVSESVKLRKTGKNFTGFCPFHANTRTPAFVVFPETGTWRCFGACSDGGDVIGFLMTKEGWDFPEALRYLAQRAGIELKPRTAAQEQQEETNVHLRELMEASLRYYRHNLVEAAHGKSVLDYLHSRRLTDETLEEFEIGYAPNSWEATKSHLLERGYSEDEIVSTGMATSGESNRVYDRFRHRIMIPIRDSRGRLCGFGARIMDPQDQPKFLNSPQTTIFDKGRLLYGLDKSRKAIRSADQVAIVEGYMDVIGLYQAGHKNVVSPMGTAISENQLRLLKRFSRNMVLALDPDVAGSNATLKGLSTARDTLDREADPVFNARGLLRHEGRLDADIRVVTLPEGMDPDEVVADDPAQWSKLVQAAQPIVDYVLEVLSEGRNLDDPKTKAEIAAQVMPLIEDVGNAVEREAYRQHLARKIRIDERALLNWKPAGRLKRTSTRSEEKSQIDGLKQETPLERFCLALLIQNPEILYRIDRQFQALEMERLGVRDFNGTAHQIIFRSVQKALAQDDDDPGSYWRQSLDQPLHDVADEMSKELSELAEFVDLQLEQPKVADEISARFLQLRKRSLEEDLSKLQFLLKSAQETVSTSDQETESEIHQYNTEVQRHAIQKARLEQALASRQGSLLSA